MIAVTALRSERDSLSLEFGDVYVASKVVGRVAQSVPSWQGRSGTMFVDAGRSWSHMSNPKFCAQSHLPERRLLLAPARS